MVEINIGSLMETLTQEKNKIIPKISVKPKSTLTLIKEIDTDKGVLDIIKKCTHNRMISISVANNNIYLKLKKHGKVEINV